MTIFKLCLAAVLAIVLAVGAPRLSGPALAAEQVQARGQFVGQKGHKASGGVAVVKTATGAAVVLEPDFRFDGAPDPRLGFGKDGYDPATQFSALQANQGMQRYELPAALDPGAYNEVWVWCERFSVPLGWRSCAERPTGAARAGPWRPLSAPPVTARTGGRAERPWSQGSIERGSAYPAPRRHRQALLERANRRKRRVAKLPAYGSRSSHGSGAGERSP